MWHRMLGTVIKLNPVGVVVLLGAAFFFVYVYIDSFTIPSDDTVSLKHVLAVSIQAAESGGNEVISARTKADFEIKSKGKTKEGANNPLTTGDVMSNRAMLQVLLSEYPRLKVVSEEKESYGAKPLRVSRVSTANIDEGVADDTRIPIGDILVLIDPLDATQEYTENLMEYVTTMVCITVKGEPIIGVIHKPALNETVWAWIGHGVSPNMKISSETSGNMTILVSRSHAGRVRDVVKTVFGEEKVYVKPAGGAGYKVLEVISGRGSAYVHVTLIKKWDICAGNAILNAIGGRMTTLGGAPITYGRRDPVENSEGLLATKNSHSFFLSKFRHVASLQNEV